MAEIEVEGVIEATIDCTCGEDVDVVTASRKSGFKISVEPCQTCLDKAFDEGHAEGYDDGFDEGKRKAEEAKG